MTKQTNISKAKTREEWLNNFIAKARPEFERAGAAIPKNVRASVGFPSTGRRSKRIGECWGTVSSTDGVFEIFLRPSLAGESRIADVLTHELIHAAVGLEAKHGPQFKRVATALGLTGKMTATIAGPDFHKWAKPVLKEIGKFPAAPMNDSAVTVEKKQTTRMIKCECDTCGIIFRTTRQNIEGRMLRCPDVDCDGLVQVEG